MSFRDGCNHLLVEVNTTGLSCCRMACGRRSGWKLWSVAVLVVLLTSATAIALLHTHKDWAPDCQLCHVRDLPSLHTHASANVTISIIAELQWQSYDPT